MPELAQRCIDSWHRFMPDWEYRLWNEDNYDVRSHPYTKEAYEAGMFAFVSDYVRLWALFHDGGLYMDVDFEVYRPFDELMQLKAFAGFEGSKYLPLRMGVIASQANGVWVKEQLDNYESRHFFQEDGSFDMTTNVQFISARMREHGFLQNGQEQDYKDLHIFPVEYFSPRQTTGEYIRTENTYCDHLGLASWNNQETGWKEALRRMIGQKAMTGLIKLKRRILG